MNCPCGADPAWSGPSGGREGAENLQGPTAKAECHFEAKQAEDMFDPEKVRDELREGLESEEDPRAGVGMDDDEETLPNAQDARVDAGGERSFRRDQEGRRLSIEEWLPEENPALRTSASADETLNCGRNPGIPCGDSVGE